MKKLIALMIALSVSQLCAESVSDVAEELQYEHDKFQIEHKYVKNDFERVKIRFWNELDEALNRQWTEVFLENSESKIEFVKNDKAFRLFGECFLTNSQPVELGTLQKNLEFAKSEGYNGFVLRFTCEDDIQQLKRIADLGHSNKMCVALAYTGKNFWADSKWSPFVSPSVLTNMIAQIAPHGDLWLLNWRAMKISEIMVPDEFYNFMCNTIRSYNTSIPIYGEVYNGIEKFNATVSVVSVIPKNVNGVILTDIGYYGANLHHIIYVTYANVIPQLISLEKIGIVSGPSMFYRTFGKKSNLTLKQALEKKHLTEEEFQSDFVKCMTLTYFHDGIDDCQSGKFGYDDNMLSNTEYLK